MRSCSITVMSLLLLASPVVVSAHPGHGDEFHSGSEAMPSETPIQVDTVTAQRLGIKVEPVQRQRLAISIKTTGQIETLPSNKVEITTPIPGVKVVELLVEPGASVKRGQPVAVLSSPDLVSLRVESQEKLAQGQADLQQAQADLNLAQQNYQRYQQIAAAEITQAETQVAFAEEKYDKDKQLAEDGALPQRTVLESQSQLAAAKAELAKANSRQDVIAAENQVKRAQSSVEVAKSRIKLSNTSYETRLQHLGIRGNERGLVTITSPITGKVADREVTLGQSFQDAGGKLMTIVNDNRVFATANIYEKDLAQVRNGQQVIVRFPAFSTRNFTGRIAVIGSVVAGDTRVVPVKATIDNPGEILKPGMFAELEVLTDQTSAAILAIPSSAIVEANGRQQVYLQNGNAYQPVEVTLGQISGDMVEVKTGLFEGDLIVTQRAPQLYAQSLLPGNQPTPFAQTTVPLEATTSNPTTPFWLLGIVGTALTTVAFLAGVFWSHRRSKSQLLLADNPEIETPITTPTQSP
ncbi:efflux RND transporter periplasmic adaptor subunit [Nodularia sp. NIES-3585]|uniref:efflux RND transporter periplasmic adaptor subunit n=1 Tax=Nodularia sp. NIES-3585 TaxID=1973477 RepID=UPI000B5C98C6|nr:efflux RND transporter periplasmic adaptor subunit [Nodularia sp. NIES-3585]